MSRDPSGATEIGPNSKMRLVTVLAIVTVVAGGAAWCTTTTMNQAAADRRQEWMAKHIEAVETRVSESADKTERRYDELRRAIDDIRYRLVPLDHTSSRSRATPYDPSE